jgi:hypothetical protein
MDDKLDPATLEKYLKIVRTLIENAPKAGRRNIGFANISVNRTAPDKPFLFLTCYAGSLFEKRLLDMSGAETKEDFLAALKWVAGKKYIDKEGQVSVNFFLDEKTWPKE